VKSFPVGDSIVVDVLLDGVSIFSGVYPTIHPDEYSGSYPPTTTYFEQNQILSVQILSVGSIVSGSDLTVEIRGHEYVYEEEEDEPIPELPTPNPFQYLSVFDGLFFETQETLEAHLESIWSLIPAESLVYAIYNQKVTSGVSYGESWYEYFTNVPITIAYKYAWVSNPKIYIYFDTGWKYLINTVQGEGSTIRSNCYIGSTTIKPGIRTSGEPMALGVYYLRYVNPDWNPELDYNDYDDYLTSNIQFIVNE